MTETEIGDEMYLSLVNECLVKEKADFFDPIKNVGLKKTKKIWKAVTVIKDGQAFGVILGEEVNLEKTFR